jgi:hypothetical protein
LTNLEKGDIFWSWQKIRQKIKTGL